MMDLIEQALIDSIFAQGNCVTKVAAFNQATGEVISGADKHGAFRDLLQRGAIYCSGETRGGQKLYSARRAWNPIRMLGALDRQVNWGKYQTGI